MKVEKIDELKAYVEGVLHGKVVMEQMGYCKRCGKWEDLRLGVCFDCAMPNCTRPTCPFKKLVFNVHHERVWKDMVYRDTVNGKTLVKCDRDEGLCSDQEYAVASDKEATQK